MAIKQNVIDDFNILSGQQKAAILMLSLDEERSASIFALMDDEEIKELSVIMASLGKVNSNVVEQLFPNLWKRFHPPARWSALMKAPSVCFPKPWIKTAFPTLWKKFAAPPDEPCGTSSAMSTSMFWLTTSKRISADHCRYSFQN